MGSDKSFARSSSGMTYFNPRPRMGSDSAYTWFRNLAVVISIHAPAWGATFHGNGAATI